MLRPVPHLICKTVHENQESALSNQDDDQSESSRYNLGHNVSGLLCPLGPTSAGHFMMIEAANYFIENPSKSSPSLLPSLQ